MVVEEGCRWSAEVPTPGVQVLRFKEPILFPRDDEAFYANLWERLAAELSQGGVVVLNFAQVRYLTAEFITWLCKAYGQMKGRRNRFIGCHLDEELQSMFFVSGLSQPLDWLLNYVRNEDEALDKTRMLLQRT
jgi:hypothetical protein